MLILTLNRNGLGYEIARAVRRTCHRCTQHWWRIYAYPGGYPREYELPARWAGGLFVREWESRSLAHFVHAPGTVWEPASMVSDDGIVVARGVFATGLFHEGPLAGHRRADEDAVVPWIPGWELVARYCLARPGHHLRGVWRCWASRPSDDVRGEYAPDIDEEVVLCRSCAEQQAAEQSKEGSATA